MRLAIKFTFLWSGLVLFIIHPTTCQEQCTFPTDDDIKEVAANIVNELGTEGFVVTGSDLELFQVHFTCLATVAKSMYTKATVVANFTTSSSSDSQVEQFQLRCVSGEWGRSPLSSFKDPASLAAMPFIIETQFQCSDCENLPPATNYNSSSNCLSCATECLGIGGGFCTGETADDCCPFFNNETGVCVDDCTTIDTDFGPDENFVCVCSIPCGPGFTLNTTNCSCELTDGCEAAGQPCENGGTCISDLLAPAGGPYYNCTCASGFSGQNCTVSTVDTSTTDTPTTDTPTEATDIVTPTISAGGCSLACLIGIAMAGVIILAVLFVVLVICGVWWCKQIKKRARVRNI